MKLRSLASTVALCALGLSFAASAVSAAELAVPYRSARVVGTGYVLWDDVYPPAIYGPYPRPVEEVQALKAERRPVSTLWWGYWYNR